MVMDKRGISQKCVEKSVRDGVRVYKELQSLPILQQCWLTGSLHMESVWLAENIVKSGSTLTRHTVGTSKRKVVEQNTFMLMSPSPSRRYTALYQNGLLEIEDTESETERTFYNLADKNQHGELYTTCHNIGGLTWSPDERYIAYIAEKRKEETKCVFHSTGATGDVDGVYSGGKHRFNCSWGESLHTKGHSTLCILTLRTGTVDVIDYIPENISPGQVSWGDDYLYCVGWDEHPFKLGLRYCTNRISKLYQISIKDRTATPITEDGLTIMTPCAGPNNIVVFVQSVLTSTDRNKFHLMVYNSNSAITKKVYTVPSEKDIGFWPSMDPFLWLSEEEVVLTVHIKTLNVVAIINLHECRIRYLELSDGFCYTAADLRGNILLLNKSSPTTPNTCVLYDLQAKVIIAEYIPTKIPGDSLDFKWESIDFRTSDTSYNGIICQPYKHTNNRLLVYSPGGPRCSFQADFSIIIAGHVLLGYTVLMVNYTGCDSSTVHSINQLLHRLGEIDVNDVHQAAMRVRSELGLDTVALIGGSHGGFITAHLIGKYPEIYTTAVLRNPVTDISTMVGSTDVPDWCYNECGLGWDYYKPNLPTIDSVTRMLSVSPILHVDKVQAPVLILLGEDDQRVPISQGIRYYQYLKSYSIETMMIVYSGESHELGGLGCRADSFIQITHWLERYMS